MLIKEDLDEKLSPVFVKKEELIDSTWTTLTVNSNFYNYSEDNSVLLPL